MSTNTHPQMGECLGQAHSYHLNAGETLKRCARGSIGWANQERTALLYQGAASPGDTQGKQSARDGANSKGANALL